MKQSISRNLISRNLISRNLLHITLTLLLGLILSGSSCNNDALDPVYEPAIQSDYYGVWKTSAGWQVTISSDKIVLTASGATYTLNIDKWSKWDNPNKATAKDYLTGYVMVGILSDLVSFNVCNEDETGTASKGQVAKVFWYMSIDKTTLKYGHDQKPHLPQAATFTKVP